MKTKLENFNAMVDLATDKERGEWDEDEITRRTEEHEAKKEEYNPMIKVVGNELVVTRESTISEESL